MDDDTIQGLIILIIIISAVALSYFGARAWQTRITEPINIEFEETAILKEISETVFADYTIPREGTARQALFKAV